MRKFERLRHIRYFANSLRNLPSAYASADTNRLTLVHFSVQALDILGALPDPVGDDANDDDNNDGGVMSSGNPKEEEVQYINREAIIEWIYSLQTVPTFETETEEDFGNCNGSGSGSSIGGGFKGSGYLGPLPNASQRTQSQHSDRPQQQQQKQQQNKSPHPYDHSHLAMTYVAICTLITLGDDLSRIHRTAILDTLKSLQKEDGSFIAISSNSSSSSSSSSKGVGNRGLVMGVTCDEFGACGECCGEACGCVSAAVASTDTTATTSTTSATSTSMQDEKEEDDCDLRFMYTAIAIWYILTTADNNKNNNNNNNNESNSIKSNNNPNYINIPAATSYILKCISYEGSLGLTPGREGHGGSTFCGIASLSLMGVLEEVMAREDMMFWKDDLVRWCVMRQYSLPNIGNNNNNNNNGGDNDNGGAAGMQGRPNKLQDTCYSYWIGGTLHLLSSSNLLDGWALREYVLLCQSPYGGFGKVVGAMPDLLHSFYSMCWLALSREGGCCSCGCGCHGDGDGDERKIIVATTAKEDGNNASKDGEGLVCGCCNDDDGMREQVQESINQFSKLDCALGICAKRKRALQRVFGSSSVSSR